MNTNDTDRLRDTRATIDTVIHNYRPWRRWITSLLADGYPTSSDYNATSRSGIADPTATTAIHRHKDANLLTTAEQLIKQIHELTNKLHTIISSGPQRIDTKTIAKTARCSGAVDPTCTNLADGRRNKTGLCDRCWQVQYRQMRDEHKAS